MCNDFYEIGKPLTKIIFSGSAPTKISDNGSVYGLATANNLLYFTDPKSGILAEMDYSGNNYRVIVERDDFLEPTTLTVNPSTREVFVAHNSYPNAISRVFREGRVTQMLSPSNKPAGLAVDPATGDLYFTDERDTLVRRLVPGSSCLL